MMLYYNIYYEIHHASSLNKAYSTEFCMAFQDFIETARKTAGRTYPVADPVDLQLNWQTEPASVASLRGLTNARLLLVRWCLLLLGNPF